MGEASRSHVRAHRFAERQLEWALTLQDPLPTSDPARRGRRWMVVSIALGLCALAASGLIAVIRPEPQWQRSAVVIDADSGTVFLNREGVLSPALNLTSALLAAEGGGTGRPTLTTVDGDLIRTAPRAAPFGIPGAPGQVPAPEALVDAGWTVCDEVSGPEDRTAAAGDPPTSEPHLTTTALIGEPVPGAPLQGPAAVLAVAPALDTGTGAVDHFLIWNGRRARLSADDPAVRQALQLEGVPPRPVSAAVLNSLPEGTPVAAPHIDGAGLATLGFTVLSRQGIPLPVGAVFEIRLAPSGSSYHLVHPEGVEQISALMADLIRFSGATSGDLAEVDPGELTTVPVARLDLVHAERLPESRPEFVGAHAAPLLCAHWDAVADSWSVTAGPATFAEVRPVSPGVSGSRTGVVIAPSRGALVGEAAAGGTLREGSPCYLITDLGVAFPISGDDTLRRLGFTAAPTPVPRQILNTLPIGPTLSVEAAQQVWDPSSPAVPPGGSALRSTPASEKPTS